MRTVKFLRGHCREFCKSTTVHGLNQLVAPRRTKMERFFWLAIVSFAVAVTVNLIWRSYARYENNPVVVSINKNYFTWNITFPASTTCLLNRLDDVKARDVIQRKWNVSRGEVFDVVMDFLKTVSESNYRNLREFRRFMRFPYFANADLQSLMKDVNFDFVEYKTMTFTGKAFRFEEVLTEEGICYSTSFASPYISTDPKLRRQQERSKREPLLCNFFNLPCTARVLSFPRPLKYYIHSPYEIPDSRSTYWKAQEDLGTETYFLFLNTEAHSSLKDLRKEQRKCHLRGELSPPSETPFYSFKLCQINCRRMLSMRLCGCVPHFYTKRAGQPFCDLGGLSCLADHSDYLITFFDGNASARHPCDCYSSCSETEYFLERTLLVTKKEIFFSGMRFGWAIEHFPKLSVSRHVIFGFEGLLVNLGGIAGFFIGSSIISAIEFVYFFTIRLLRSVLRKDSTGEREARADAKLAAERVPSPASSFLRTRRNICRQRR